MRHPRRNEVFRDVGSRPRTADERGFHRDPPLPVPAGCGDSAVQRRADRPSHARRKCATSWSATRLSDAAARGARIGGGCQLPRGGATTSPRCSWPGPKFRGRGRRHARPACATTARSGARHAASTSRGGVSGLRAADRHAGVGGAAGRGDEACQPRTRIGRYEIVRRIGQSMTDVYLAIDTVENRKAALKLIRPGDDAVTRHDAGGRDGAARPFSARLRALDPRVVEIYEYGELDGYFFVAMQYVEGRNLAEVLERERVMDPRPRRRHRARNLRAAGQVPRLAIGGGARRYQAVEHSPGTERYRAAAGFRHRQNAARSGDATASQLRQPGLLRAGAAGAFGSGPAIGPVGGGRDAVRNAGGRAARTRPKTRASWKA